MRRSSEGRRPIRRATSAITSEPQSLKLCSASASRARLPDEQSRDRLDDRQQQIQSDRQHEAAVAEMLTGVRMVVGHDVPRVGRTILSVNSRSTDRIVRPTPALSLASGGYVDPAKDAAMGLSDGGEIVLAIERGDAHAERVDGEVPGTVLRVCCP